MVRSRIGGWVCALLMSLAAGAASRAQTGFVNWETPHVSPLALTPAGTTLLAVNTADSRLEVFELSTGVPVPVRSVPVGLDPVSVRARSDSEAWVVNHVSDSISIVDLPSGRVVRTLLVGDEPADVVFAGSPTRAFVSVSQLNQVRVFDPANLLAAPVILNIQGEDPRAMATNHDGSRVYVGIFESGNRSTIVDRAQVSAGAGPYGGLNPPPNFGSIFDPPLTPGLPAPPAVAQIVRQDAAGQWLDDNGRNWSAFVTWGLHDQDVAIIDTTTLSVTYARGLMTTVAHLAVAPSGQVTAVGTEALNQIRFEPNVSGIFVRCELASFNPATPASVTIADLNPHLDYMAPSVSPATRDLSVGDPRGIVWDPSGDRAYVSGMGSNNVAVMSAAGARLGLVEVGEGPTGLAMSPDGMTLFVLNKFEGAISVVDVTAGTETARVSFFDPTPVAIKAGRPFLYDTHRTSGLGQASCASCHIDGRNDGLAWDLGDPSGEMKVVNQECRQGDGNCGDWHPMKGPMVSQTLVGIVGAEPLHWRGDREDLAAFGPAFVGLQGADASPDAEELQQFTDFIATIAFPPNPNRLLDGNLPAALATQTGAGNAQTGLAIYQTQRILGGALTCAACHALPTGTDQTIDDPGIGPVNQSLKVAHLRNMHEKTGFNRASLTNNRGFGFNHDSDRDTLFALLSGPGFVFPPGPPGQQQRRDLEAFMLAFTNDTHAAVGQQVTFDGANNNNANLLNRYNTFIGLADAGTVGLVVKGRQNALDRGYVYAGPAAFQSDRVAEAITADSLRASAIAGSELTYTVVPIGTQVRIGVDRDADGFFDRDELDAGSNPSDAGSIPPGSPGDLDGDGDVDSSDFALWAACLTGPNAPPGGSCAAADLDSDIDVDLFDFGDLQAAFTGPS